MESTFPPKTVVLDTIRRPAIVDVSPLELTGRFTTFDSRFDRDGSLDATRVTGTKCDRLWAQLGHGVEPSALT